MRNVALTRSLVVSSLFFLSIVSYAGRTRNTENIRKDGWHTGERKNIEVDVAFSGQYGETVTDETGTSYHFCGYVFNEDKVYPPEYWGVFPMYFFGTQVGVTVSINNKSPVNTARLSLQTEVYCLATDGNNGVELAPQTRTYVEIGPGETKTVDASFVGDAVPGAESGLDRLLIKILRAHMDGDGEVDFDIADNKVTPTESFKAELKILGSAITSGGEYDIPVTVQLKIGDGVVEPWGDYDSPTEGNVNDGANPRVYEVPSSFPSGVSLSLSASSWLKNQSWLSGDDDSHWHRYLEVSTDSNSANLTLLKNGDDVPNVPGFMDQDSLAEFVKDYVQDGKIVLDGNQALFLLELGTTDLNSAAADFQDLVVLLSLSEDGADDEDDDDEELIMIKEAVFCPPEYEGEIAEAIDAVLAP